MRDLHSEFQMIALIKILGIIFLGGLALLWIYCYFRGRQIVNFLKRRHPTLWEEAGKPHPDYFSPIINSEWTSFISQEEYSTFRDAEVGKMCRRQKQWERRALVLTIVFFTVFGGIALWDQYGS